MARGSWVLEAIVKGITVRYPFIRHHGAGNGATGSCHQVQVSAATRPFKSQVTGGQPYLINGPSRWPELLVILDSAPADRFTDAYRALNPFWNQKACERVESGRIRWPSNSSSQ